MMVTHAGSSGRFTAPSPATTTGPSRLVDRRDTRCVRFGRSTRQLRARARVYHLGDHGLRRLLHSCLFVPTNVLHPLPQMWKVFLPQVVWNHPLEAPYRPVPPLRRAAGWQLIDGKVELRRLTVHDPSNAASSDAKSCESTKSSPSGSRWRGVNEAHQMPSTASGVVAGNLCETISPSRIDIQLRLR